MAFSRCYDVFCVFKAHDFHHFSPFSPVSDLHLLSLSSPLLFSSLLFSSPLRVFRCLCCGRFFFVLCCCRLFFSVLCCHCCCCVVAAGRRRCSCCCCWWVMRVLERLFLASFVDVRKPREMRALRPDWSLENKAKIKHLRRGASDESRPLKRRRASEVLAEIETAVTETPRQTLSVLRRHSSQDMTRSTLWRALHEDLRARCIKPVRAQRLTAESRLAPEAAISSTACD